MPADAVEIAPDGSIVHRLCRTDNGSMAQFTFAAGAVSRAVMHKQVEELWYVLAGSGQIWRAPETGVAEVDELKPGSSVAIPARCAFQVRVEGDQSLTVIAVTLPPWPGDAEAVIVDGCWQADA